MVAVWVFLGAGAQQWPGRVRESALLNDDRKSILHENLGLGRSHLPLVPEKRSQREALFRRLAACAWELCLFVRPLADDGGRPSGLTLDAAENGQSPWLVNAGRPLDRSLGDMIPESGDIPAGGVEIPVNCAQWPDCPGVIPVPPLPPLPERVFHLSRPGRLRRMPILLLLQEDGAGTAQ